MISFSNKKVLVTGGTGMVGRELVPILLEKGANVTIVSLDNVTLDNVTVIKKDLREFSNCLSVIEGQDIIFHVAGVKGSPAMTKNHPSSFFIPMLQFNTNVLEATRLVGVEWCLYTSTVGVYGRTRYPYQEDKLWNKMPSKNDWFAGWAKRMGELQIESYKYQFGINNYSIVRPVNIYGKWDNFDPETGMVIPSLIVKALHTKNNILKVWGDGTQIRDFIHASDVARAMAFCVENKITLPVNIGSGKGITIKELVTTIVRLANPTLKIVWDRNKPRGDKKRVADTTRLTKLGFVPIKSLDEGIYETIEWYKNNTNSQRFDIFKEFK